MGVGGSMISVDLLIKNADYFDGNDFSKGNILVKNGKICDILGTCEKVDANKIIDAKGLYVLPGIIDSHMHFRDPGNTEREDFFTGSQAAAAGGVTMVCEMPISKPPVYNTSVLANRIKIANEKSLVDFAFYGAAGYDNISELKNLMEAGVIAFKTFLHPAPDGRDAEFKGLTVNDDGQLYAMMQEGAKHNVRFFFHTENYQIIKECEKMLIDAGVRDNSFHYKSRPKIAEIESAETIIRLAETLDVKVGICHISCPEVIDLVDQAKARGVDIIAETCPHYLIFDHSQIMEHGPYGKCNPPLRSKEDVNHMWERVLQGSVDIIGSDHAPFIKAEKEKGIGNIRNAFAGMPGIEMLLRTMLSEVNAGKMPLAMIPQILSENTAKVFGIYPQKGCIQVGSDADFTIIDMNKPFKIDIKNLYTKARDIAVIFHGYEGIGQAVYTIVRGCILMKDGVVDIENKGHGSFVKREACYEN
jgi:dihydropyrimidinase/allantoinase